MEKKHKTLEMKYFIFKMNQKMDIDLLGAGLLNLIPYGESGHKIVTVKELAQLFLDSMID
jgi:hypothetical protein